MRETCPHSEFWSSIPGLVKDGCTFTASKTKQLFNKARGKNYETV